MDSNTCAESVGLVHVCTVTTYNKNNHSDFISKCFGFNNKIDTWLLGYKGAALTFTLLSWGGGGFIKMTAGSESQIIETFYENNVF